MILGNFHCVRCTYDCALQSDFSLTGVRQIEAVTYCSRVLLQPWLLNTSTSLASAMGSAAQFTIAGSTERATKGSEVYLLLRYLVLTVARLGEHTNTIHGAVHDESKGQSRKQG